MADTKCLVCATVAKRLPRRGDFEHIRCPRCGEYKISDSTLEGTAKTLSDIDRAKISGWTFEQNRLGAIPQILDHHIQDIRARKPPSVQERADRLLGYAIANQTKLGDRFNTYDPRYLSHTYSTDAQELNFLLRHLHDLGFVRDWNTGKDLQITANGHLHYDAISQKLSASSQGFVAMWFDKQMDEAYENGLKAGIEDALYKAIRVSAIDHIDKIDDRIIAELRKSRFVVADFTGHRGGVYFEAGFALGLNIPVFWSCRTDHMDKLHFDIRQYNCIDWTSADDLRKRLRNRIEAVLGRGPLHH